MNLTQLITLWIGEKKAENVTSLIESEYEYQRRNNQCIGYNNAIKDLKSKIPDLIEQIEELQTRERTGHEKIFKNIK